MSSRPELEAYRDDATRSRVSIPPVDFYILVRDMLYEHHPGIDIDPDAVGVLHLALEDHAVDLFMRASRLLHFSGRELLTRRDIVYLANDGYLPDTPIVHAPSCVEECEEVNWTARGESEPLLASRALACETTSDESDLGES